MSSLMMRLRGERVNLEEIRGSRSQGLGSVAEVADRLGVNHPYHWLSCGARKFLGAEQVMYDWVPSVWS